MLSAGNALAWQRTSYCICEAMSLGAVTSMFTYAVKYENRVMLMT